jgi:serine protease AprX
MQLPEGAKGSPPVVLADRDGDGVSDGLQARLAEVQPDKPLKVIVTFSGPGNAASARAAVGDFEVKHEFRLIKGFAATMTAAQVRALSRAPGVFRIEEDFKVKAYLEDARADFGADRVVNSLGYTGNGVGICVVDTGVDYGHEQLDNGKVLGFCNSVAGGCELNEDNTATLVEEPPFDDHGHGTHVAAIAAGDGVGNREPDDPLIDEPQKYKGVAPGAKIYAAKVLDFLGSGSESQVMKGIDWCLAPKVGDPLGVHIISLSLGSDGASDGNDAMSLMLDAAVNSGIHVVAAAGNSGAAPQTVGSPGAARKVITVGAAANQSEPYFPYGLLLAAFSSRGPALDGRIKPDIVAPGVTVVSALAGIPDYYVDMSGTSMATPFVSGAIALALEANPDLKNEPTVVKENLLKETAQYRGPPGVDKNNEWGWGLLDAYALVDRAKAYPGVTSYDPTQFPSYIHKQGEVADHGVWEYSFNVTDTGTPVAATITIDPGVIRCSLRMFGMCLAWEWSPDIEMELIPPSGDDYSDSLLLSECPLRGFCGAAGRQETVYARPKQVGVYTIKVFPYELEPNNGKGGSFALNLEGPVETLSNENQPPLADAGPDQKVTDSDNDGAELVTLDGSASYDPDGIIDTYQWYEDSTLLAGGAAPTVTLNVGTHTITLEVADDDGAVGTDQVVIAVEAKKGKGRGGNGNGGGPKPKKK